LRLVGLCRWASGIFVYRPTDIVREESLIICKNGTRNPAY
jgi:hypothetical protein